MAEKLGLEHWTKKGDVRLFLFEKPARSGAPEVGTVLFVHGSSMASQPTFDLHVEGRPSSSVMDWFSDQGFDTWCVDMEGYGRSDKSRNINFDISNGADDLAAASEYILKLRACNALHIYGISSGALRAAFSRNAIPNASSGSLLTLSCGREREVQPSPSARRSSPTISRETRGRLIAPSCTVSSRVIIRVPRKTALSTHLPMPYCRWISAMPTGTYVDMCSKLPVVAPQKITMPTLIMRGEYDGIAALDDLLAFFKLLPNADKQFSIMPGIAHASFQQKNYMMVYHILHSFFSKPDPVYRGEPH